MLSTSHLFLCGFVVLFSVFEIKAVTNSGREFILAFIETAALETTTPHLIITTTEGPLSDVLISAPLRQDISVTLDSEMLDSNVMHVTLGLELVLHGTQIQDNGIWIKSPQDITLQCYGFDSYRSLSSGGFMAYPVESLGLEYVVVTYCNIQFICEFAVVATENDTSVWMYLVIDKGEKVVFKKIVYTSGSVLEITLEGFQTIQIQSKGDLTGTRIKTSASVSVFSGARVVSEYEQNALSYFAEQLPPVFSWGDNYVISTFPNALYIKVVVNESTNINIDGSIYLIDAYRRFSEHWLYANSLTVVTTDHPVLVAQFFQLTGINNAYLEKDASFVILPPVGSWRGDYVFSATDPTGSSSDITNITVTTRTSCIEGVLLNGEVLSSEWTVKNDNARVTFHSSKAIHCYTVKSQNCTLYGTITGQTSYQVWTMPLGWYFKNIVIPEDSSIPSDTSDSTSAVSNPITLESSYDLVTSATAQLSKAMSSSVDISTKPEVPVTSLSGTHLPDVTTLSSVLPISEPISTMSTVDPVLQPSSDYLTSSNIYPESGVPLQSTFTNIVSTVGAGVVTVEETVVITDSLSAVLKPTEVSAPQPQATVDVTAPVIPDAQSTAEITTTSSFQPTAKNTMNSLLCSCVCRNSTLLLSDESLQVLKEYLTVDKRTLSATTRRYISVEDNRPSAIAVGFSGIVFLCLTGIMLSINDLISAWSYCYSWWKKTNSLESSIGQESGMDSI